MATDYCHRVDKPHIFVELCKPRIPKLDHITLSLALTVRPPVPTVLKHFALTVPSVASTSPRNIALSFTVIASFEPGVFVIVSTLSLPPKPTAKSLQWLRLLPSATKYQ